MSDREVCSWRKSKRERERESEEGRRGMEAAFCFRSIHAVLINEYDPTARHSSTSFCRVNFINRPVRYRR